MRVAHDVGLPLLLASLSLVVGTTKGIWRHFAVLISHPFNLKDIITLNAWFSQHEASGNLVSLARCRAQFDA